MVKVYVKLPNGGTMTVIEPPISHDEEMEFYNRKERGPQHTTYSRLGPRGKNPTTAKKERDQ